MRRTACAAILALTLPCVGTLAQGVPDDPRAQALQTRLFPDLVQLQAQPAFRHLPATDAAFRAMTDARRTRIAAAAGCTPAPACMIEAYRLTPGERDTIGAAIARVAPATASAWPRDAAALDAILSHYGEGTAPRYPKIDAIDVDPKGRELAQRIDTLGRVDASAGAPSPLAPILSLASDLLIAANRDNAIRDRDTVAAHNAAAIRRARHTNWRAFPYTAIIVPGLGPEEQGVALAPSARVRLRLAAAAFRNTLAPFLIVSGGAVHPARTPFIEAEAMRDSLITEFGIPADRILVDPFARHTTTNLRNAVRVLAQIEAPLDRPALIVTDAAQTAAIRSDAFVTRNRTELGYMPGTIGEGRDAFETPFTPDRASLTRDPSDPMDP